MCSIKIGVLKNFATFTGKWVGVSFLNKVADLRHATLLKKRLQYKLFPVNFAYSFYRKPPGDCFYF